MHEQPLLARVLHGYQAVLGPKLTGLYIHGSIAFGCYSRHTGDVDFLAVVQHPLTLQEKEGIIRLLLELDALAPPKGFEMSVVLRRHCAAFQHPMPFELHFSNAHKPRARADLTGFCRAMHGTDADLAAHITVLHRVGLVLYGPPVAQVFAPVPRSCYVQSILADIAAAAQEITAAPVYMSLNLCRVLAFLTDDAVLSKEQGGMWGLVHLPEAYHPLLRSALDAYRSPCAMQNTPLLTAFAADMLQRIHALTPPQLLRNG